MQKPIAPIIGFRNNNLEQAVKEPALPGQPCAALAQESKAKRGMCLEARGKFSRKECRILRYGHQSQRTPAHAQEVPVKGVAVRNRVELRSDGFAEVEQLRDERVERVTGAHCAREEGE